MAVWIAFAGLLFTVFMAAMGLAYRLGKVDERVNGLEKTMSKESGTHDAVIALQTQMTFVVADMSTVKQGVTGLQRQMAGLAGLKPGGITEISR